jgi:hypothetical protein
MYYVGNHISLRRPIMAVTLADRIAKQAKVQARAEASEARLKIYVRKARTRNLIAAGALIEQAGLLELGPGELLRMLQACQTVLSRGGGPEKLIRALQSLQARAEREEAPELQSAAE